MNGVRESEEWTYRDVGVNWKLYRQRSNWKLLVPDGWQKSENLLDLCFLFNNALNCMQHNEISQWFQCPPPSFEIYVSNGPRMYANIVI